MGEPTDARAREMRWFKEFDQDARSILLNHYTSQRQHWGWTLVTLGVVFFAVSQAKDILFFGQAWIVRTAYGVIAAAAIYPVIKIYWLGSACSRVLSADPSQATAELNQSYLAQIEAGVYDIVRSKPCFIHRLSNLRGYGKIFLPLALFFSLLFSLPSILSSVLFRCFLLGVKSFNHDWFRHLRIGSLVNALIGVFWLCVFVTASIALVIYLLELRKTSEKESKSYMDDATNNKKYRTRAGPETYRRWVDQWTEEYNKLEQQNNEQ